MARRAITDVRVQDFQKRRAPSKHYVYIIYVSWSDNSSYTIYRRYSKFFDLQMQLLDKFPVQGGQKDPKQRTIPFLPGKILFRRSHIRDVAVRRLKPIDEYCRALVQLPAEISQCEDVLEFFEARAEDLNPPKEDPGSKRKPGSDGIAEALVLEQYVVVAEYKKQQNSELNLVAGQVVEVIEKTETGWWFVSAQEEQGWVPATYLEPRDGSQDDLLIQNAPPGEEERYMVMHSYAAQDGDELELDKGALIDVLQKNLEGWWFVRYQGKEGWAPASYLRKVRDDGPALGGGRKPPLLAKRSSEEGAPWGAVAPTATEDGATAPSVARVTPQRSSSTESPKLRQRPPPRRDITLPRGSQLPSLPEPPVVEAEYYTIAEFQSGIADGITFGGGQNVEVIEKNANGWWYVQIGDHEGWAPSSYIDKRKRPSAVTRKLSNVSRPRIPPPAPPSPGADPAHCANEYDTPAVDSAEASGASEGAPGGLVARARMQLREVKRDDKMSRALSPTRPPPPIKTKQLPNSVAAAASPLLVAVEKPVFPGGKKPGPPLPDGRLGRKPKPDEWKKPGSVPITAELGDDRAGNAAPCNGSPKLPPRLPLKSKLEKCPSAEMEKGGAGASEAGLPVKALVGDLMNAFAGLKPASRNEATNLELDANRESKAITAPSHPPIVRPKPSVKPRPAMPNSATTATKYEESQGNQIDISNLRSHLRPTRQRSKPLADSADSEDEPGPRTRTANGGSAVPPGKGAEQSRAVLLGVTGDKIDGTEETVSLVKPKRPPPPKRPTTTWVVAGNSENCAESAAKPTNQAAGFMPRPPGAKPGLPVMTTKPTRSCPALPTKPIPVKASNAKAAFNVPVAAAPAVAAASAAGGKNALLAVGRESDGGGSGADAGCADGARQEQEEEEEDEVYVAMGDYDGDEDTLAVREGAALRVLEKDANGWWFCQPTSGRQTQGWVPSNYLRRQ